MESIWRAFNILVRTVRIMSIGLVALVVVTLPVIVGQALGDERHAASPGLQAPPAAALVTHENAILGYQISLPVQYRRVVATVFPEHTQVLGRDSYTFFTAGQELADCQLDSSDVPLPSAGAYVDVTAYVSGPTSAVVWANRSAFKSPRSFVEPAVIDGRDAARIVENGATLAYVVRANDRIYVLAPTLWPSQHQLDDIAGSFHALVPQPFPTPTARTRQPRDAAADQAKVLAAAFAAGDASAIERLLPACRFGVSAVVEPVQRGSEVCCILNRSVSAFTARLRELFARRELSVVVDPQINVISEGNGRDREDWLYVRSTWTGFGSSTPIDLFLREIDGVWYWTNARHHYQRDQLANRGTCVQYRSPWVVPGASC